MTLRVSDHALLRYLERRFGVNVEGYREEIAARCATAHKLGCPYLRADGLHYVLKDDTVVTVKPVTDVRRPSKSGQTVAA